jgi:hypothetical protein
VILFLFHRFARSFFQSVPVNYGEAAMIGYVQTDTLECWHNKLQERVQNEANELKLDRSEAAVKFQEAFPLEWASTHRRDGLGPVKLLHILFDCRKHGHEKEN